MSVLLLYALIDDGTGVGPLPAMGLAGRPLRTVACGQLTAIVSEHERAPGCDVESLWCYEQLLERVMARAALLPARFGTTFADDRELVAAVSAREPDLCDALQRVRGAVEIAVRAPADAGSAAIGERPGQHQAGERQVGERQGGPGRAYMLGRLAARARQRQLARELERALGGLVRARAPRGEGSYALLVDHANVEEVARRARELGLLASGPWPPFNFTGERASESERAA